MAAAVAVSVAVIPFGASLGSNDLRLAVSGRVARCATNEEGGEVAATERHHERQEQRQCKPEWTVAVQHTWGEYSPVAVYVATGLLVLKATAGIASRLEPIRA